MFIEIVLWFIFIGSAILLSVVILLQEAKGGGLAEAFGGMGAQTFGVKASGINKFTAYVAVVFMLSAILITCLRKGATVVDFQNPDTPDLPIQEGAAVPGAPSGAGASGPGPGGPDGAPPPDGN